MWGRRGDYQLSLYYLDEVLSFIMSERAWYTVQRDCGMRWGTGCRGRWRHRGGRRGRKLCLQRLPWRVAMRRRKLMKTKRMWKRTPCSPPTCSISAHSAHTHTTSHHYPWHPMPLCPHEHPHHQSPLFLHTPFLCTPHHPTAHCRHTHDNLRIQPVHAPAILADTQAVPNVPGGLEGPIPSFPLAELFMASRNMPINQEMLYFNWAEVDINLGMGGLRAWSPRGIK
jgi:hypothetical protein